MAVQAQTMYCFSDNLGMSNLRQQQDWALVNPPPISDSGFDHDFFSGLIPTPQAHQQRPPQFHQANRLTGANSSVSPNSTSNNNYSFMFSDTLRTQLDLQRQEMDYIVQLQNEKLRFALQEQRKRQLAVLLSNFESRASSLMRQKEEHLTQARKRAIELQDSLRKAEMESETWQRVAKANESMVIDLNNTLDQVNERMVVCSGNNEADDAESYCGSRSPPQVLLSEKADGKKKQLGLAYCKSCKARMSCVLFLPCRHLCSCKFCEAFLDSCPVCKSTKEASLEVFLV